MSYARTPYFSVNVCRAVDNPRLPVASCLGGQGCKDIRTRLNFIAVCCGPFLRSVCMQSVEDRHQVEAAERQCVKSGRSATACGEHQFDSSVNLPTLLH
jgi:hypothetical protein